MTPISCKQLHSECLDVVVKFTQDAKDERKDEWKATTDERPFQRRQTVGRLISEASRSWSPLDFPAQRLLAGNNSVTYRRPKDT